MGDQDKFGLQVGQDCDRKLCHRVTLHKDNVTIPGRSEKSFEKEMKEFWSLISKIVGVVFYSVGKLRPLLEMPNALQATNQYFLD